MMTKEATLSFIKENAVGFNERLYLNLMGKTIHLCENGTEKEVKSAIKGSPVQKRYRWGNELMKELTSTKVLLYQQTCDEVLETPEDVQDLVKSLEEVLPQVKQEIYVLGSNLMQEAFGKIIVVPRKDPTDRDPKSRRYLANKLRVTQ